MAALNYMRRTLNRARNRGISDTIEYGYHIARKRFLGAFLDLRYGGRLSRTAHDWARNPEGRYANTPTDVYAMDAIFDLIRISARDVVVDVGCGDGRAIAYFLNRGIKNRIIGVELLKNACDVAAKRFSGHPNVEIIHGDATTVQTDRNLFFLYNPFSAEPTAMFERSIRGKDVRVVYYNFMHLDAFSPDYWDIEVTENLKPDYKQFRCAVIKPCRKL